MGDIETQKKIFSEILQEIKINPEQGLKKFYQNYGKIIRITAKSVCPSPDIADGVINGVLIKVWRFSASHKTVDNPNGWVYTVTLNTAKDALKEKRFNYLSEDYADPKDSISELIGEDYFAYMISLLSEEERRLMIAKFIEKLTFKEIAKDFNKNINTVSTIYYRALEKIRKELEAKDGI